MSRGRPTNLTGMRTGHFEGVRFTTGIRIGSHIEAKAIASRVGTLDKFIVFIEKKMKNKWHGISGTNILKHKIKIIAR